MDKFDVFRKAEEYALEVTNSKLFNDLVEIKKQIDNDFSSLIKEFKEKRDKFESVREYALYNDSIKKIQLDFQEVKERLYKEEIVQKYFAIEREIQAELNDVAKRIAKSISERFK